MTTNTQIMWTCLPNGVATTGTGAPASPLTLKASIVVTPRLVPDASGGSIAGTVFENWPAYVRAIASQGDWSVAFARPETKASAQMTDWISASSAFNVDGSLLWQSIFPPSTPVMAAQVSPNLANLTIHSYDAGKVATAVREAHRYAVHSHAHHGKLVLTGSDPYSVLLRERKRAKQLLPKMAAALRGVSRGAAHHALHEAYRAETGDTGIGYELMRHALFYDLDEHRARLRAERAKWQGRPEGTASAGTMSNDFNSLLAHLGGQPQLQRKLGLIIDLQFTPPTDVLNAIATLPPGTTVPAAPWKIFMNMPAPTKYAATFPAINLSAVTYIEPATFADVTGSLFRTTVRVAPKTGAAGNINNGYLPLGDASQYTLYTEDTEGGPIKLDVTTGSTPTNPAPGGMDLATPFPALRTAGIAISQAARDKALEGQLATQGALAQQYWLGQGAASDQLHAEDVVRGYVLDVQVKTPDGQILPFQSVCLRDTRMFFPGLANVAPGLPTSFVISDEGYVKASAPNAPGDGDEIDLHSALVGWEGWSLAAQRPGRTLTAATPAGDTIQTETPLQPVNTPDASFPNCQFTVRARAKSLPRLRFGYTYTFRARLIDLAGNDMTAHSASLPIQPLTTSSGSVVTATPHMSPAVPYQRYEPVPNPVLVLQAPLTEGEHVENLVIRSNPWGFTPQNAAQYAAAAAASSTLQPMNPYQATTTRVLAPPKGPWAQAEQMGAFDPGYFDPIARAVAADVQTGAIAPGQSYSGATFLPTKTALFACSRKEAGLFTDTQVWDTSNPNATSPSATNPVQIFTPPAAQNLPPPTSPGQPLGTGQYNLLLNNGSPLTIPYLPDLNARGVAFQQLDASAQPIAGATAQRSFAPRLPGGSWPELDMPQIVLQDGGVGGALPNIGAGTANPSGLDGSSPASNTPIVFSLAPGQQLSLSYGSVVDDVSKMASSDIDPSGQKLETIPTFAPYRKLSLVHAVQQPKPPSGLNVGFVPRAPGDTGVTLTGGFGVDGLTSASVDLTGAWVEPVDVTASGDPNVIEAVDGSHRRMTVKQGRIQTWTMTETDTAVAFPTTSLATQGSGPPPLSFQFGDTKTRLVSFQATATTRFREYFPQSLQADATNFQNSCPPGQFSEGSLASSGTRIPSTARPISPKILFVVPTYAWSAPTTKTDRQGNAVTTSVRTGRGLRVFVDRPWFTTGDTEQLAVVVNPSGTAPTAIAGLVSQWGLDATRYPQADKLAALDQSQVVGGTIVQSVGLAEMPGTKATVVAFNPSSFDPDRNLWFFDIEFAASAVEAPFVRLALARFQPNSLGAPAFPYSGDATLDLRMSTVVLADMVKLSADRTGTYTLNRQDGSISVTVQGHVYADAKWSASSGVIQLNTRNDAAAEGRMVFAQVLESTAANPGEFDWYPVGPAINLLPYQPAGSPGNATTLSFIGSVPKPTNLAAGSKHKLLITEHEVFLTDTGAAFPGAASVNNYPGGPMQLRPSPVTLQANTTSRIVFSDVLPLPY